MMLDFKNDKINILVATDIVARGIDIDDIGLVINFDVPHDPEDYIHRIGRTGRASATGRAITFVNVEEQGKFHRIEKFIEREVPRLEMPAELGEAPEYNPEASFSRSGGRSRSGAKKGGSSRTKRPSDRAKKAEEVTEGASTEKRPSKKRRNFRRKPKSEGATSESKPQPKAPAEA